MPAVVLKSGEGFASVMNNTLLAGGSKPKLASMDLSSSQALVASLTYVEVTGSTNVDLAAKGGEDLTVLVAGAQTAGKGRAGREWSSPVGASLSVSILLKPKLMIEAEGGDCDG